MARNLITLAEYKDYASINSTDYDTKIASIVTKCKLNKWDTSKTQEEKPCWFNTN